jgi:trimethylamine--corrinoid protein Co-methyltransferase
MFTTAGVCDAKVVDQQAAAEAALTLMVDAQHGGNLVHDLGYMEMGLCGSLAQLVICDELVQWIKAYTKPIPVDAETLAVDLIEAVGPDGQFLEQDHTRLHYREKWYPLLIDRDNLPTWQAHGSKTMAERAADRVNRILAKHQAEPLPSGVVDQINQIVARSAAPYRTR